MKKSRFLPALCFLLFSIGYSAQAQTDSSGYFTSFDGVKIHYEVHGRGKPVLLIHGFTGSGSDWKNKPVTDSLLSNGFSVVLVDLRGNGLSDQPTAPEAYANNAEAKDLVGLISFLGIPMYDAVGYSRGSIILASLLVLDKRCTRAVIGGMGADFTNPFWPRRIGFYQALIDDTIPGYADFRKYITQKGLNPLVLAAQQKEQPSTSKAELARLNLPVLIICGDQDADNGKGSDLQLLIPNARFVEVSGNHNSTAWTAGFAEQVMLFLR